jgi:RND family efflux transporter MFP subunit
MLVDVMTAQKRTYRPEFIAQGTVEPAKDIVLSPQVGGRVTTLNDAFVPGGYIEQGEQLLQIQPEDFRHTLAQRESELRQAKSDLAIERGRRAAAQAEYDYVDEDLSAENKKLLLREPQLESAKAQVDSAQAAVDQARLNLRRSSIEAPFDAHVIRRDINVGSQVATGDDIGRLIGMDNYWVAVELPGSKLPWVTISEETSTASSVQVRNEKAWPDESFREGFLFKKVGILDEETRMVRLLASIPDPLARQEAHRDKPELMIGEFVEVQITGNRLENVVRLNRDYVRDNQTVWLMQDGVLQIEPVDIEVRDSQHVYISDGIPDEAKVVTTNISTVTEGAALRINAGTDNSGASGNDGAQNGSDGKSDGDDSESRQTETDQPDGGQ